MYRMPAEWEKHEATWLAWPHNKNDWPGKFGPIPWVYAEIIAYLTQVERVRLIVRNEAEKKMARDYCKRAGADVKKIDFYIIPTDRIWMRDSGPIFVKDSKGKKAMLDWRFNAWAKYANHKKDDLVPSRINERFKLPRVQPMYKGKRVVLEGGAIDVNGKGTLLTTESCLLHRNRNPNLTKSQIEKYLRDYYGQSHICWLGDGIVGDDTDGHIDDLARFLDPRTIVVALETDRTDGNFKILRENYKRAQELRDQDGRPFNIVEIPMPGRLEHLGQRLPATYLNFLFINGAVLVPTFRHKNDRLALAILQKHLPRHKVVGVDSVELIWGLGSIHCLSQQQPA